MRTLVAIILGAALSAASVVLVMKQFDIENAATIGGAVGGAVGAVVGQVAASRKKD